MRNVALDLGVRSISYCEVRDGQVVDRATVRTLPQLESRLGRGTPPARVAFEACREGWHVYEWLGQAGHEPVMLDTTRVQQLGVGHHRRKADPIDAEAMARAVERGPLPAAHVLSAARRELRNHLAVREALVTTRAQYVTTCRGLGREVGVRFPSCQTGNFADHARRSAVPAAMQARMEPLLTMIGALDQQIAKADEDLAACVAREPVVTRLATVPGVGMIVAASFVAAVDEAGRFPDAHAVESYLGLVPSESSSGGPDQRHLGRITKQGNRHARAMLVQAAWIVLRTAAPEDPLRVWAGALVQRRGRKIAVVALARRLAGVLWALWRKDQVYDPVHAGRVSARGTRSAASGLDHRATTLEKAADKLARRTRRPAAASTPGAATTTSARGRARPTRRKEVARRK